MADLRRYAKAGLHHLVATPILEGEPEMLTQVMRGMEMVADEILPLFQ